LPVIRPQYAGKLQVKLPPDIFADPNGASIQRMRAGGVARKMSETGMWMARDDSHDEPREVQRGGNTRVSRRCPNTYGA
jgi:hypothetical protein